MRRSERGRAADSGEAFWRFSLALYARPAVAEALIRLQDRAGYDVNLILFALWAGAAHGVRLDAAAFAAAEATVADLRREIVEPLRAMRRRLKSDPADDVPDLRRRILGLELAAERRAQYRLAASLLPGAFGTDRFAAADANLVLYLGAEARSPEADLLRAALAALTRRGERHVRSR
jgi:uncharacterized protein (TIGR02444 family)